MPSPFKFLIVCVLCVSAAALAAAGTNNDFVFDHLSLNVADPGKATEWYASHFGGTRDGDSAVRFGSVRLSFRQSVAAKPSAGTVIDHLAFVADMSPVGFSEDPWGTRIEIVRGKTANALHHIHVVATNPDLTMNWLAHSFGGERERIDGLEGVKFGTVLVAVERVDHEPSASAGHVIDHMGWATQNLDAAVAELTSGGVKFTTQPRRVGNLFMAFVEGPNQLRVEIVQR
jgi:hypothetical protein